MQVLLPKLSVPEGNITPTNVWPQARRICVEIGFGGGEHLLHQANQNPLDHFIGFEPFQNGMAKMLVASEAAGVGNLSLEMADARLVLARFESASVDQIHILYPDPWPKRRHWKRRLITSEFVAELVRLMRPGADLRFVSDIAHYQQWALSRFLQNEQLQWQANSCRGWQQAPLDHCTTKYEQKAFRENRRPAYLQFKKKGV
jgi:tRNA (guanine-N7-)-methyltransferase